MTKAEFTDFAVRFAALICSTGVLMVGAGHFYIGYGDQGEQKSARRTKLVGGEWDVLIKI